MSGGAQRKAITDANAKVDRALRAGALAVGAKVEIETLPGYMPLANDATLVDMFERNSSELFGEDDFTKVGHRTGSTDMGDVTHLIPAIHPMMAGGQRSGSQPRLAYLGQGDGLSWTGKVLGYHGGRSALR